MKRALKAFLPLFFCMAVAVWWSFSQLQQQAASPPQTLQAWVLDVGQGESLLVRDPSGKKLLFDGGPDSRVLTELGQLLPPWDRHIDLLIISHNHSDHLRGMLAVLERYNVDEVWISGAVHTTDDYKAFLELLKERSLKPKIVFFKSLGCPPLPVECIEDPPKVAFGQSNLQVYHPLEDMTGKRPDDQHDAIVVVKLSYKQGSLLLTGDIDEGHEAQLMEYCVAPRCSLEATVLQIPHHGSASGLSPEFLAAVSPQAAVIPVGKPNRYGHPAPGILKKLAEASIPTYRSDIHGRIEITLDSDRLTVKTER